MDGSLCAPHILVRVWKRCPILTAGGDHLHMEGRQMGNSSVRDKGSRRMVPAHLDPGPMWVLAGQQ
jgi:hypothetical protein